MYNHFTNGSEAWYAMKEFIDADQEMDRARGTFETAAENACSMIDDLDDQVSSLEEEKQCLQEQLDEKNTTAAKRYMKALVGARDVLDEAIRQLRVEFGVEETDTDGSAGDRVDGGPENPDAKDDESGDAPWCTRPQVP